MIARRQLRYWSPKEWGIAIERYMRLVSRARRQRRKGGVHICVREAFAFHCGLGEGSEDECNAQREEKWMRSRTRESSGLHELTAYDDGEKGRQYC